MMLPFICCFGLKKFGSSQNSYEVLTPNVMGVRRWGFSEVIGHKSGVLMSGILAFIKRPKNVLLLCLPCERIWENGCLQPRRGLPPEPNHAPWLWTPTLQNCDKFLLISHPVCSTVLAAWTKTVLICKVKKPSCTYVYELLSLLCKPISERCTWQIVFSKNSHSSISSHTCSFRILPLLIRRWSVFSLSLEHESRLVTAITKSLAEVLYVCDFFRLVPKKHVAAAWFSPSPILS